MKVLYVGLAEAAGYLTPDSAEIIVWDRASMLIELGDPEKDMQGLSDRQEEAADLILSQSVCLRAGEL